MGKWGRRGAGGRVVPPELVGSQSVSGARHAAQLGVARRGERCQLNVGCFDPHDSWSQAYRPGSAGDTGGQLAFGQAPLRTNGDDDWCVASPIQAIDRIAGGVRNEKALAALANKELAPGNRGLDLHQSAAA